MDLLELTQGKNLGDILEKERKGWNNLLIVQFPFVRYFSRSWNKDKEVVMPPSKCLLYLLDTAVVTSPQEGCCYCLGVGEASWKKSVVWGNVKQAGLALIRKEGDSKTSNDSKLPLRVKGIVFEIIKNIVCGQA